MWFVRKVGVDLVHQNQVQPQSEFWVTNDN